MDRWTEWRQTGLKQGDGIIVASDVTLEWLLPWWWEHYHKSNQHPVVFIDFGMSGSMQKWCRERGEYVRLLMSDFFVLPKEEIDAQLIDEWETIYGKHFFSSRGSYFKKPFACLQSPFQRTVWIDLDCEVRGSLKGVFDHCENSLGVSLAREMNGSIFNSGVIVFQRGSSLISEWAKGALHRNHLFATDQDLLSDLIKESKIELKELPLIYNWSRARKKSQEALIVHWHGVLGKKAIYQIMNEKIFVL